MKQKNNIITLDKAIEIYNVSKTFDEILSYSYYYTNNDNELFESDVIDNSDYTDITLDYMFERIPKYITLPNNTVVRLSLFFNENNNWEGCYIDNVTKTKYFEENNKDLLILLEKIEKNIYKN
jgi:hypothetical protein